MATAWPVCPLQALFQLGQAGARVPGFGAVPACWRPHGRDRCVAYFLLRV